MSTEKNTRNDAFSLCINNYFLIYLINGLDRSEVYYRNNNPANLNRS